MTMKATTDGEVASIRVRLEQATWLTSPLAQQAGGANIADITYNTHSIITPNYIIWSNNTFLAKRHLKLHLPKQYSIPLQMMEWRKGWLIKEAAGIKHGAMAQRAFHSLSGK